MTSPYGPLPLTSTLISLRGPMGRTWWGRQFLENLTKSGDKVRLNAGKTYARNGRVQWIEAGPGYVEARVTGSHLYSVKILFTQFSDESWKEFFSIIGNEASFAALLMAGTIPEEMDHLLTKYQISIFPDTTKKSKGCSCPDSANPCKHEAAVLNILTENLDGDPFLLFLLLGKRREEFLTDLRQVRREILGISSQIGHSPVFSPAESSGFFEMKPSAIGRLRVSGLKPSVVKDPTIRGYMMAQLGKCPSILAGRNLGERIADLYPKAAHTAARWASEIENWPYDR
ncbi:MAG: hypothetical protein V1862_03005 [Methanobacteriota archaeon]